MEDKIFNDVYNHYKSNYTLGETLKTLAIKYGYKSGEHLRWDFKSERNRRGIPSKMILDSLQQKDLTAMPRIAVFDIEVLPLVTYAWNLWESHIGINQIIKDSCLLCWSGKLLNGSNVISGLLTPEEAINRDSERIVRACWDFLSKQDVIIGHNIVGFDTKFLNVEFLKYNLPPLKFTQLDTYLIAKQSFRFTSNKLDYINTKLGIRNKISNDGFPLWRACDVGDEKALRTMQSYNIGDIFCVEDLYYRVRPYIKNFNIALYNEIETPQCPVCGHDELQSEGFYYSPQGKWESLRCPNCGALMRGKENLLSKAKKKVLKINS